MSGLVDVNFESAEARSVLRLQETEASSATYPVLDLGLLVELRADDVRPPRPAARPRELAGEAAAVPRARAPGMTPRAHPSGEPTDLVILNSAEPAES